jgi:hypothetical protein
MNWGKYWRPFKITVLATFVFICGCIYIVNPYGDIPFAPPFTKALMATNQRFSYPSVARNPDFDSAVFGTSTSRLLQPKRLDQAFGGSFANLAMNSATAYEESRIFEVFLRRHPAPNTIIIGVDISWCRVADHLDKYTFRPFPEWMYDSNPWNDIPQLLSFKTLEITGRKIGYLTALRGTKYDMTGYRDFLPPASEYDIARAREHLYGSSQPKQKVLPKEPVKVDDATRKSWNYPALPLLEKMMANLPDSTRKVLFFVPYHAYHQATPGTVEWTQWDECKSRVANIVGTTKNGTLADFMIPSPLTTVDSNYWDSLHYSSAMSVKMVEYLKRSSENLPAENGEYRLLETTAPPETTLTTAKDN